MEARKWCPNRTPEVAETTDFRRRRRIEALPVAMGITKGACQGNGCGY
jgi:hypothetical protein